MQKDILERFDISFVYIMFSAYVKYFWPKHAKNYVGEYSIEDYKKTANLAILHFDKVKIVTRAVLINTSKSSGIPSS